MVKIFTKEGLPSQLLKITVKSIDTSSIFKDSFFLSFFYGDYSIPIKLAFASCGRDVSMRFLLEKNEYLCSTVRTPRSLKDKCFEQYFSLL